MRKHRRNLERAHKPQPRDIRRPEIGDVAPVERYSPTRRRDEFRQHVETGRLAGAVRADERVNRPALDAEGDVADRAEITEALAEAFRDENVVHAHSCRPADRMLFLPNAKVYQAAAGALVKTKKAAFPLAVRPSIVQPAFPVERLTYDIVEMIAGRLPAEDASRPVSFGHDGRGIARPSFRERDGKIDPRHALDDLHDLLDRLAVTVAAIADDARSPGAQIGERAQVRIDEVRDLAIVPHTRAVAGWIILAEDIDSRMEPKRGLDGALDQMCGVWGRLAEAPLG